MTQTKLRGRRPFGSPTADDDLQGLYHFSYWCEFPTHLHRRLRLTSPNHSGEGTDFGLLAWPGLLMDVNFYIWDGRLIRWWAQHETQDGVFRFYRHCDTATSQYWYFFQHWAGGLLDGMWEFNHVWPEDNLEKANWNKKSMSSGFYVPSDPGDWASQIDFWGVLPGHDYPPPASDERWEEYHA